MSFGDVFKSVLAILLIAALIFFIIFFTCVPSGRRLWNDWFHKVQEADDETNYETLKKVEDTCRAMIASYTTDKLVWEQYKDSYNPTEIDYANQAKMRANQTAATYNEYILKNSHVWRDDVPSDIFMNLPYIQ